MSSAQEIHYALASLHKFSKSIDFEAAPFITFLIDKAYGVGAHLGKITSFFRLYNLETVSVNKSTYTKEYIFTNPFMRKPYKNVGSCIRDIDHFRQPLGYGCWNGRDLKSHCQIFECKYHPTRGERFSPCNFSREVIWKRATPNSEYVLGNNYISVIQKQLLKYQKIPLMDLLTVFYSQDDGDIKGRFEKFKEEFNLNPLEIDAFFSNLHGENSKVNPLTIQSEFSKFKNIESNVQHDIEKKIISTSNDISAENVLQKLQMFAIENGRVPSIFEPGIEDIIRAAQENFGSLKNALSVAGLLVEKKNSVKDFKQKSKGLTTLVVDLLNKNPMRFRQLCEEVRRVPGFAKSKKGTIWRIVHDTRQIKSIGPRRLMVYFLEGQEYLATERLEINSKAVYNTERVDQNIAYDIQQYKKREPASDTLTDIVIKLLDRNPMKLKPLCEKVRTVPGFASSQSGTIGSILHNSIKIRSIGPRGQKVYFLEGQEELAIEKNEKISLSIFSEKSENTQIQENKQFCLIPLNELVLRLLDGYPMEFRVLVKKIRSIPGFENTHSKKISSMLLTIKNIKVIGAGNIYTYYIEGQENLISNDSTLEESDSDNNLTYEKETENSYKPEIPLNSDKFHFPNYWLFSVVPENWKIMKRKRIWAVRNSNIAEKVKRNDYIVLYVTELRAFCSIIRIDSDWYQTKIPVWSDEIVENKVKFPYQAKIELIQDGFIRIFDVLQNLSFIKNKLKYGVYVQSEPANMRRPIPNDDYSLILEEMKNSILPSELDLIETQNPKPKSSSTNAETEFIEVEGVPLNSINLQKREPFEQIDENKEKSNIGYQSPCLSSLNLVVIDLLKDNSLSLRQIKDELDKSEHFIDVHYKDLMKSLKSLQSSKLIKKTFLDGELLYYLEKPKNHQVNKKKGETNSEINEIGFASSIHSSDTKLAKSKGSKPSLLAGSILRLLNCNPMKLDQLLKEVKNISHFKHMNGFEVSTAILELKQIRTMGPLNEEIYFWEGQDELARKKLNKFPSKQSEETSKVENNIDSDKANNNPEKQVEL